MSGSGVGRRRRRARLLGWLAVGLLALNVAFAIQAHDCASSAARGVQ